MTLFQESRITLKLAIPLMIGQLSQMLLGVADTVMVGHLGVTSLAALTLVNSLFYIPFVFGIGLLSGISVFTANARGSADDAGVRGSCRHGFYLSIVLGCAIFAGSLLVAPYLDRLGQPAEIARVAKPFFLVIMASIIPALASMALKNHADALNRPWPPFWIFLGGVVLNVILNWVLIYGKFGLPQMGFVGAAWATLIARVAIVVAMLVWLVRAPALRGWVPVKWFRRPDFTDIRRLLSIGLPSSFQMVCEVSAFSLAGLIMGRFGSQAMAAHQIALTLAATAFMLPLGLSMALTVRMGDAQGAGEISRLRGIATSGWLLAGGYSLLAAIGFLVFGKLLASLFVADPGVIALTATLLVIVGIFQLVDSLQVVSSAMLRGLQDARIPALLGFSAYWLVGLPVAFMFAFHFGMGPAGVWWGLAAGLAVACFTLGPRLFQKTSTAASLR